MERKPKKGAGMAPKLDAMPAADALLALQDWKAREWQDRLRNAVRPRQLDMIDPELPLAGGGLGSGRRE